MENLSAIFLAIFVKIAVRTARRVALFASLLFCCLVSPSPPSCVVQTLTNVWQFVVA